MHPTHRQDRPGPCCGEARVSSHPAQEQRTEQGGSGKALQRASNRWAEKARWAREPWSQPPTHQGSSVLVGLCASRWGAGASSVNPSSRPPRRAAAGAVRAPGTAQPRGQRTQGAGMEQPPYKGRPPRADLGNEQESEQAGQRVHSPRGTAGRGQEGREGG